MGCFLLPVSSLPCLLRPSDATGQPLVGLMPARAASLSASGLFFRVPPGFRQSGHVDREVPILKCPALFWRWLVRALREIPELNCRKFTISCP
jgi:hypothetical protein